jgi:Phage integrase family
MRSAELVVAFTFKNITEEERGLMIHITRTKTDYAHMGDNIFVPKLPLSPHNPLFFYHQYLTLVPTKTGRFFRNCQKNGKYTKQHIGKNKIAKIAFNIATSLNLPNPNQYTGHSLRVTSATICADAGISITNLKRLGGWKSDSVVEGYLRESKKLKIDTAAIIAGDSLHNQTLTLTPPTTTTTTTTTTPPPPSIIFDNTTFNNCTFNVSVNHN